MKNRRQKAVQPKRVNLSNEEQVPGEFSSSIPKNTSTHTKISTNCTIHSTLAVHPNSHKRSRNKKIDKSVTKENVSECYQGHSNSKSGRKSKKYELLLDKDSNNREKGE